MSRNAVIGVVVGSCVVLGLAIAVIYFLIRFRQHQRNIASDVILLGSNNMGGSNDTGSPNDTADFNTGDPNNTEDPPPQELTTYSPKQEMWAGVERAEMPAPWSPLPLS